jgi:hypothetical membrane protein
MIRRTTAGRAGAIVLLTAPIFFLIAEAIAALAWPDPRYNYIVNFVSDLGVPGPRQHAFGQTIYSPLAWVMNTGFIGYGILVVVATALLLRLSAGARAVLLGILALLLGIGVSMVGLVHGSQQAIDNGTIIFHTVGAFMCILAGNLISILIGVFRRELDVSHRFAIVSTVLGIVGLVGYTVFIVVYTTGTSVIPVGIFERLAIYPVDVVQLMIGTALLARWARRPADVILERQATTQPAATSATSQ